MVEESVTVESETLTETPPVPAEEAGKDVGEEKAIDPLPVPEEKPDKCEAPAAVEKDRDSGSENREEALAKMATEKRLSLIHAWEESEKSKAENKAHKRVSEIEAWEHSKTASLEAEIKAVEEELEKKKGECVKKMRNKIASIHKCAEEKKGNVEAKKAKDFLKAEETATKYRSTGTAPKKLLGLF